MLSSIVFSFSDPKTQSQCLLLSPFLSFIMSVPVNSRTSKTSRSLIGNIFLHCSNLGSHTGISMQCKRSTSRMAVVGKQGVRSLYIFEIIKYKLNSYLENLEGVHYLSGGPGRVKRDRVFYFFAKKYRVLKNFCGKMTGFKK